MFYQKHSMLLPVCCYPLWTNCKALAVTGNTIKDKINKQCPNSSCTTISNNLISLWKHVSNKSCRKPPILDILPLKYYLKLSTRLSLSSGINAPLSPRTDWIEQICTYEWLKQHCVAMHCSKHILGLKYKAFSDWSIFQHFVIQFNAVVWRRRRRKKTHCQNTAFLTQHTLSFTLLTLLEQT